MEKKRDIAAINFFQKCETNASRMCLSPRLSGGLLQKYIGICNASVKSYSHKFSAKLFFLPAKYVKYAKKIIRKIKSKFYLNSFFRAFRGQNFFS